MQELQAWEQRRSIKCQSKFQWSFKLNERSSWKFLKSKRAFPTWSKQQHQQLNSHQGCSDSLNQVSQQQHSKSKKQDLSDSKMKENSLTCGSTAIKTQHRQRVRQRLSSQLQIQDWPIQTHKCFFKDCLHIHPAFSSSSMLCRPEI